LRQNCAWAFAPLLWRRLNRLLAPKKGKPNASTSGLKWANLPAPARSARRLVLRLKIHFQEVKAELYPAAR
jgi:hypothetical protein